MLTNVGHASILCIMTEQIDWVEVPEWTLGWRIQRSIDHGGLKHKDLMDKFEVSRETVSRWCRDIGVPPKKFILNEIAVMCHVPARWLIDGTDPVGPDGGGGSPKSEGWGFESLRAHKCPVIAFRGSHSRCDEGAAA